MCKPKNLGGLGILNTSVMNKCLIVKWWWKIFHTPSGLISLKRNTSRTVVLCLLPSMVARSFGVLLFELDMSFGLRSSLWWVMGPTCAFDSIGGLGIPLSAFLFLLLFS